jgi:hypothetical protein
MKHKIKVALNLQHLSVTEKVQRARVLIDTLKGNGDFLKPYPSLETIAAAAALLETANAEMLKVRELSIAKTAIQQEKEKELDILLQALGSFIEVESRGDETKIKGVGLAIKAVPAPIDFITAPDMFLAPNAGKRGSIRLKWKSVRGGKSYIVQISDNIPAASWEQAGVVSKPVITLHGLTSSNEYWFRVASIGNAGQSEWSKPFLIIAP